ncbi:hypothetical protein QEH52_19785 [Coraliomargarita sp. SDUM461003]|uniref:Uncharacterized protein n=1 Tax=Thalassobacterium maritimum TaxID=3041265 RepID=A0ABU1B055_9BACT|nr:hypothetical protein [Coraliomargarita sp. SDUM461003]MDQ8209770.1 hypothetical protein [Coraliomargarita sp. SDUM461003]
MKQLIIYTLFAIITPIMASDLNFETRNEFAYIEYEIGGEGIEEVCIFKFSEIDTITSISEKDGNGGLFHTVTITLKSIAGVDQRRQIKIHKIRKNHRDELFSHLIGHSTDEQ